MVGGTGLEPVKPPECKSGALTNCANRPQTYAPLTIPKSIKVNAMTNKATVSVMPKTTR